MAIWAFGNSLAEHGAKIPLLPVQTITREAWLGLSADERIGVLRSVWPEELELRLIDAPTRWEVIAAAAGDMPPGDAGHRLMELEAWIRRDLQLPLEVYSPAVGDLSKLRQKLQRERGQQVDDWFARREETKRLGTGG